MKLSGTYIYLGRSFQESTMKRSVAMTLALLFSIFIYTYAASAVDPPHYDLATGNSCVTCHANHLILGSTGYNNVCQNCHRPGDAAAGAKPITPADAANPFGIHSSTGISKMYQTSHRWDGSTTNLQAGARPPVQAQMTTSGLLSRTGGQLACVSCHNQHSNANGSFLRMANDQDQMCLDCHRSRNTADQTKGTHPVGVAYDGTKAGFKPITVNGANPTADLNNYLKNGKVSCTTCHGVHATDSHSGTVDGSANFANLSGGDGNLLRVSPYGKTTTDDNICTTCHDGKKNHNLGQKNGKPSAQCNHCHSGHVEFDAAAVGTETTPNVFLVRRYLQYTTAGRLSKRIVYNSTTTKNFYSPSGGGVCQSCHNPPANHLSGTAVEPGHTSCTTCHKHDNAVGAFSASGGHSFPYSGSLHMITAGTAPWLGCNSCHNTTAAGAYPVAAGTAPNCTACHINGLKNPSGTSSCWDCHGVSATNGLPNGTSFPNTAGSHWVHAALTGVDCATCHNGGGSGTATHGSSNRTAATTATVKVVFTGQGANPLWTFATSTCTSTNCHGQGAPTWGTVYSGGTTFPYSANQCEKCHGSAATNPFYSTATPKVTANTDPKTGAHTAHLFGVSNISSAIACLECHTIPATVTAAGHMDGTATVTFNSTLAKSHSSTATTCATTWCHGGNTAFIPQNNPVRTAPAWGTPFGTTSILGTGGPAGTSGTGYCAQCHGYPPLTASHTGKKATDCIGCHGHVNATGTGFTTKALHINGQVDVIVGACDSCHGYPPARPGFTPATGNWLNAKAQNYSSGGGAHTVQNHVSKNAVVTEGFTNCTRCHNVPTDHEMSPIVFNPSQNIKVNVDQRYRFAPATQAKYTSNRLDGPLHIAGTCSNISCHNGATPAWNQSN